LDTQDNGWRQTKQKTHHYTQTNTNNVNKTWALIQTTWSKDEPKLLQFENLAI
jgi:hypothetical protein